MKTAKEYIERMRSDKDFPTQMSEKVKAILAAGEKDSFVAISKAARELGYEVSPEQIKEINRQNEDVSEEELGKLAGGTSCTAAIVTAVMWASAASVAVGATMSEIG